MASDTPIPPALSEAEWEALEYPGYALYSERPMTRSEAVRQMLGVELLDHFGHYNGDEDPARVIALENERLPEAQRITHADLAALREASVVFRVGDTEMMQDDDATARLRTLATKLASWLPPHATPHD